MRCLLKLASGKDQAYDSAYHVKLQGFIYNLVKKVGFESIHDEEPFKFLCFSNIFPPQDMEEGDERNLIVCSPHKNLIETLSEFAPSLEGIDIGDQQYELEYTKVFQIVPVGKGIMITGTPIVVRIPASKCGDYGMDAGKFDDVYWRMDHNPKAFIDSVEDNLASKYSNYYNRNPPNKPYFTGYKPRKEVSVPLRYEDREVNVIGTTWELEYECTSRKMHRLIRLAYGAGLGELNTTGFGFMNEVD